MLLSGFVPSSDVGHTVEHERDQYHASRQPCTFCCYNTPVADPETCADHAGSPASATNYIDLTTNDRQDQKHHDLTCLDLVIGHSLSTPAIYRAKRQRSSPSRYWNASNFCELRISHHTKCLESSNRPGNPIPRDSIQSRDEQLCRTRSPIGTPLYQGLKGQEDKTLQ